MPTLVSGPVSMCTFSVIFHCGVSLEGQRHWGLKWSLSIIFSNEPAYMPNTICSVLDLQRSIKAHTCLSGPYCLDCWYPKMILVLQQPHVLVLDMGRRRWGQAWLLQTIPMKLILQTTPMKLLIFQDVLADSSLSRLASAETTEGWQFSLCLADIRLKHTTLKSSDLFTDKEINPTFTDACYSQAIKNSF